MVRYFPEIIRSVSTSSPKSQVLPRIFRENVHTVKRRLNHSLLFMEPASADASGLIGRFPEKRQESPEGQAQVEGDGKAGKSEE